MSQIVLAITGPAGSGKTTIAAKLAKNIDQCVNIDVDHVKHFIVNGFNYDESPEGIAQWQLLAKNITGLANNFLASGYNIIISGYLSESAWGILFKNVKLTHKILLMPQLATAIVRDKLREGDKVLGEDVLKTHYEYFLSSKVFEDFIKIDSTNQNTDETIDQIKKVLGQTWLLR